MHPAHISDNQLVRSSPSSSTTSDFDDQQAATALLDLHNAAPPTLDSPQLSTQQAAAVLVSISNTAPPPPAPPQFSDQQAAAVLVSFSTADLNGAILPARAARNNLRQPQHAHRVAGRTLLQRQSRGPLEAAALARVNGVVSASKLHPGQQPLPPPNRTQNPHATLPCPRCRYLFMKNDHIKSHFKACVERNGNPRGLHWYD